jgi:hypothetical protein
MAKLLAEDVTDEGTWAELERLARVATAEDRLAAIYATELDKITADEPATARLAHRTGELFEARAIPSHDSDTGVGMSAEEVEVLLDRALVFYRRAYQFAPEDEPSKRSTGCSPSPTAPPIASLFTETLSTTERGRARGSRRFMRSRSSRSSSSTTTMLPS